MGQCVSCNISSSYAAVRMIERVSKDLDAVRGLSAIVVAVAHYIQIWVVHSVGYSNKVSEVGGLAATYAVVIFFALSGFMIALSMSARRDSDGNFDLAGFFKARFYRLLPPYYFAVALSVTIVAVIHFLNLYGSISYRLPSDVDIARETAFIDKRAFIWTILLFYGILDGIGKSLYFDGPLWSLSIECWLYLLAAVWGHAWFNRSLIAWSAVAVSAVLLFMKGDPGFLLFGGLWGLSFAAGLSYAAGYRLNSMACVCVAVLGVSAGMLIASHDLWNRLLLRSPETILGGGIAILALIMWRAPAADPGRVARLLALTADWSYTLYLVHFPILLLGFSLTRLIVHPFEPMAEYMTGFGWLLAAMVFSKFVARFIEDRRAIRSWVEARILSGYSGAKDSSKVIGNS